MKIRLLGEELLHADGQTDGWEEVDIPLFAILYLLACLLHGAESFLTG
jgi:hypothetical protein